MVTLPSMRECSGSIAPPAIQQKTGLRNITVGTRALPMKVEVGLIMAVHPVVNVIRKHCIPIPALPAMTVIIQMEREGAMVVEAMIRH